MEIKHIRIEHDNGYAEIKHGGASNMTTLIVYDNNKQARDGFTQTTANIDREGAYAIRCLENLSH